MSVDFFSSMEISASGLAAERMRMNAASSNLANAQTTETAAGGPFKRLDVVLQSTQVGNQPGAHGVMVKNMVEDASPPRLEYDPGHPDADVDGYVAYPNVNVVEEMVDMITASRAYEAGVTALNTSVTMAERALGIGK
jgi:flagellar basal-body rod protein FlgC